MHDNIAACAHASRREILTFMVKRSNVILSERILNTYIKFKKAKKVKDGFSYRSDNNSNFLTIKEIKKLITKLNI